MVNWRCLFIGHTFGNYVLWSNPSVRRCLRCGRLYR